MKVVNVVGELNHMNKANSNSNLVSLNSQEFSKDKNINPNSNIQKDQRTPTKLIKKEIINNYVSNKLPSADNKDKEKQKVKEVYLKMSDFDSKLENSKKKQISASENKPQDQIKRPQSVLEKENQLINRQFPDKIRNKSFKDDDILQEFIKYNINKKILENPNIKNSERVKMIIPKSDKSIYLEPKDLKSTELFLNDNKKRTQFFQDLNLKDPLLDKVEATRYLDELMKGSISNTDMNTIFNDKNFNIKASINDFIIKNNDDNPAKNKEDINSYLESLMDDVKKYQNDKGVKSVLNNQNKTDRYISKIRENNSINIKMKPEETENIPSIPLFKKDMNNDFSVCYINDSCNQDNFINSNNFTEVISTQNNSKSFNKERENTKVTRDNNDSYEDLDEECEEEEDDSQQSYYGTDEEAVEIVKDFRNTELTEKRGEEVIPMKDDKKIKELNELKCVYMRKFDFHKNELKNISGDVDFNKIYQAYQAEEVFRTIIKIFLEP